MSEQVVWTQWDDLNVPNKFKRLSPTTTPIKDGDFTEVTFYVPWYMGGRDALELTKKMPKLKVLQVPNAGYDDAIEYVRPGMTLCNGKSIHDDSTAELAVGLTIASLRGFPDFVRNQDKSEWVHVKNKSINDRKIGIIGFGSIGQTLAKYLEVYEVSITGYSRSGGNGAKKIPEFDSDISNFDVIFLILPLNTESHHYFNTTRLSKMKDGALLINVARGPVIDTDALVKELYSKRIFAGLDVTDPEPLPKGHPLWSAPNCIIAPHVGGDSTAFESRGKKLVEQQLSNVANGQPLMNRVN